MQHNASQKENKLIQQSKSHFEKDVNESQQTILTCPECGGVLWEVNDGAEMHYACHVGHRYSEGSLLVGKAKALEDALWVAVRSLEERASLSRRLANRAKITGKELVYEQCLDQAEEAERSANIVRSIILNGKVTSAEKQQNPLEE